MFNAIRRLRRALLQEGLYTAYLKYDLEITLDYVKTCLAVSSAFLAMRRPGAILRQPHDSVRQQTV